MKCFFTDLTVSLPREVDLRANCNVSDPFPFVSKSCKCSRKPQGALVHDATPPSRARLVWKTNQTSRIRWKSFLLPKQCKQWCVNQIFNQSGFNFCGVMFLFLCLFALHVRVLTVSDSAMMSFLFLPGARLTVRLSIISVASALNIRSCQESNTEYSKEK